jgi:hypothetical protein
MSTLVELTKDVWGFGNFGDVKRFTDEELKELDAKAKKLGVEVYKVLKDVENIPEAEVVEDKSAKEKK